MFGVDVAFPNCNIWQIET